MIRLLRGSRLLMRDRRDDSTLMRWWRLLELVTSLVIKDPILLKQGNKLDIYCMSTGARPDRGLTTPANAHINTISCNNHYVPCTMRLYMCRSLAETQHMNESTAITHLSQSLQRAKYFCISFIGPGAAAAYVFH